MAANPAGELDGLVGQSLARKSNVRSNEAPTKAPIPLEAIIPLFVPPLSENLFKKFMKVFMETMQAQAQALVELWEPLLKASSQETYSGKSHIDGYHFCQQCEGYFKTSDAIWMNHILFVTTFLYNPISLKEAQY